MKNSTSHQRNERHLLPHRLARKRVRVVYFQRISHRLPNDLPNTTGVLAEAAFRLGSFHVQADLRLLNKKGGHEIKIVSIFDLTRRKWVSHRISDYLRTCLRVRMMSLLVRAQAKRCAPGEGQQ